MAAGNSKGIKKNETFTHTTLKLSNNYYSSQYQKPKVIETESFNQRESQELKFLYFRNATLLQQNIKRIFNESIYYDLKIIHGHKVVYSNLCIIKIRSPWFYSVIKQHFHKKNKIAVCYVRQLRVYYQIKNFIRLLYTNLDIDHYEQYIIQNILNDSSFNNDCNLSSRALACERTYYYSMNCCPYENVQSSSINESSSMSSDMADSGLETGSMVSPHGTISENSSTDLDEPNESNLLKKNYEISDTCGESCSVDEYSLRETGEVKNENSEYDYGLGETFCESSDIKEDCDRSTLYLARKSYECTEASPILLSNTNEKHIEDRSFKGDAITQNGKKPNIIIEQHHDINNSSTSSNYYFIDASTLSDDLDVTTSIDECPNERLTWTNSQVPSCCYIPTTKSNNFLLNNDSFKVANQKTINVQNQYKEITSFESNFKFSESHQSLGESRKLKNLDSLTIQSDLKSYNNTNKESLVVEIKEADSGESAQHSPCPDNTKIDNVQKDENKLTIMMSDQDDEKIDVNGDKQEQGEEDLEQSPSLIRRNTFELDANDEKLSSLRQEYERHQGSIVFQNSITEYSQHRVDGDSYCDIAEESKSAIINKADIESASKVPELLTFEFVDKYDLDSTEKENKHIESLSSIKLVNTAHTMSRSTSDKLLANYDDVDISFNSLPVNINGEVNINQEKSRLRRNEAAPIVSGGSCTSDFTKPIDSPIAKRKLESTPIVSGGSVITEDVKVKDRSKLHMSSLTTAWVVDMSDCLTNDASTKKNKEIRTPMSASFSSWTNTDKGNEKEKDKSQPSSLGFFVNFDDIGGANEDPKPASSKHKRRASDIANTKNYCEFFVDFSDKPKSTASASVSMASPVVAKKIPELMKATMTSSQPNESKKNMFSMFIDLSQSETSTSRKGVTKSSSSSTLSDKRSEPVQKQNSDDRTSVEKKSKSGVFMFIDSDSPIVRRRTLSSSRAAFKRHSWNSDKSGGEPSTVTNPEPNQEPNPASSSEQSSTVFKRIHKRAHSLSVERAGGDFRKLLAHKSSNSSHSLHEALAGKSDKPESPHLESQQEQEPEPKQTDDTFEYEIRDTPPNSHIEIVNEELLVSLKNRNYQELNAASESQSQPPPQQDDDDCCSEGSETNRTRKSETFDISTSASGPSSTSDNPDDKVDELMADSAQKNLSISNAETKDNKDDKIINANPKTISNTSKPSGPSADFVRLSDLDKRPLSSSTNSSVFTPKSQECPVRLSSSVTETSWIENKLIMSTRMSDYRTPKKLPLNFVTGSKFQHFDDFGMEADPEAIISESDLSSLQSSMCRSGQEGSAEDTETSTSFAMGKPYNRLGEDLLRMFLEEINPDVTIDVAGRRIRAHKCILSSRCQYFAAMLSGGWIESAGNVISLQGYSYNAVHFALCHIYSGESCIPDSISIVELATLADMLCLEGLKEVIGFTLKVKYCHLFHKPCNGCAVGVLECMPLAAAYGLDEVYRKSLRWITRHFVRIWPTKEFATLPRELMDKCYHQHIVHMSADNVLQTIMDCDKLLTTLPIVRWAEPVFRLVSNLLDASMKYLTDYFTSVLGNESFQALDRELTWNISRLQDHLLAAAERLPPEQACKAYSKLDKMFTISQLDDNQRTKYKWSPLFSELMNKIRSHVEKCLIRDAARAARTNAWLKMNLDLRRRIQELACLVILPNEAPKRPSRHSNFLKEPKERQEPKTQLNASRTPPNKNLDLRRVKMVISEQSDKTLKQTPLLQTRKLLMNKPKTDPLERKVQTEKLTNESSTIPRPKSWPNKMEIKSRYLEPRCRLTVKESMLQPNYEKTLGQQRRKIMISSSDSSRTSSPAMKRAAEKKTLSKIIKVPIKKDGKALSSDSLTECNSRLSVKKDVSKSCGITRPESPLLKPKDTEAGLSVDSLSEPKKRSLLKKPNKMDTSMSTDSLMTDITSITTPKSMPTNKSSPILSKAQLQTKINQARNQDTFKKSSPPTQQRNVPSATRRPARSLEGSTAASRSRAAAIVNTYSTSLSLRKSLLDAAKAPDIPSRTLNSTAMTRTSLRQSTLTMRSSFGGLNKVEKFDKKDETVTTNERSNSSPVSKRSPKSNVNSRLSKSTVTSNKPKTNKLEDKTSNKVKSHTTGADGPKFLNQSSRSGTFLKDEPTILKKSDIETAAIDV